MCAGVMSLRFGYIQFEVFLRDPSADAKKTGGHVVWNSEERFGTVYLQIKIANIYQAVTMWQCCSKRLMWINTSNIILVAPYEVVLYYPSFKY